ncbi:hypothetical protein [Salinimonas lutimaris]|uniref:hypothetical protein n=1 Tax=Salinimonas lutimaris TaxID=914153 RepID=UPI001586F67A|nr:hypothetical protein [Salinimonas lutimaris]
MCKPAAASHRYVQLAVSEQALQCMVSPGVFHISEIHCNDKVSKRTLQNILLKALTDNK